VLGRQEREAYFARCKGDIGVGDASREADGGRGERVVRWDGDFEGPEAACNPFVLAC
jgi:hypothetical protein